MIKFLTSKILRWGLAASDIVTTSKFSLTYTDPNSRYSKSPDPKNHESLIHKGQTHVRDRTERYGLHLEVVPSKKSIL